MFDESGCAFKESLCVVAGAKRILTVRPDSAAMPRIVTSVMKEWAVPALGLYFASRKIGQELFG